MTLSLGLIKADIIAANHAIEYYDSTGIKDIKNIAAYHLQQACEKLIKYQIYSSGVKYNNHSLYTHNIVHLIAYAKSLGIKLMLPRYINDNAVDISDWEAGSRYDISFSVRIDRLRKCYEVIEKWYDHIQN